MTKYETVVGFEETGRIQFFGYPKVHSACFEKFCENTKMFCGNNVVISFEYGSFFWIFKFRISKKRNNYNLFKKNPLYSVIQGRRTHCSKIEIDSIFHIGIKSQFHDRRTIDRIGGGRAFIDICIVQITKIVDVISIEYLL